MTNRQPRISRVGAQRLGHEYQDLVALGVLVDWLAHSERYQWIKVEADDAGYLDDLVALRSTNCLVVTQVKFSNHPDADDDTWTWKDLLHRTIKSRSLLQKWSHSLQALQQTRQIEDAFVITNRRASPELARVLDPNTELIVFDEIHDDAIRNDIIGQLGSEARARDFFALFRFRLNQPNLNELEEILKRDFVRQLRGTELGWKNLQAQLRTWVAYRDRPNKDGFIYLADVRSAAQWTILDELPQEYSLPEDYVLPSGDFHQQVIDKLLDDNTRCLAIAASPGVGKSSYCSYLFQQLRKQDLPVIRHHYYLSTSDRYGAMRLDFEKASASLLHSLVRDCKASLGGQAGLNPLPNALRDLLETSGAYYYSLGQKLVVILDGLDHVWRERDSVDELRRLLDQLLPAPRGVTVLLALQPLDDNRLPPILLHHAPRAQWLTLPALSREAVDELLQHHLDLLPDFGGEGPDTRVFTEILDTLYTKSSGHPLYLHYALKTLKSRNAPISTHDVLALPDCPHEDINDYYSELWHSLTENDRAILYLLTTCRFLWSEAGIYDCLWQLGVSRPDSILAFKQVGHLLRQAPLGWQAFHNSLYVFIEASREYQRNESDYIRLALDWLNRDAPEYLKWGHQWLLEAAIGDPTNLLSGTTREWAVEAFSKRRSHQTLRDLMTTSLHQAVDKGALERAFEIALLYDHSFFHNNYDFDREVHEMLLLPQLTFGEDPYLHQRLQSELHELNHTEVAILAETCPASEDSAMVVRRCMQELNERLRRPPERYPSSWQSLVFPFLRVASLRHGYPPGRVLQYAANYREHGYTQEMLWAYEHYLWKHKNTDFIRQALSAIIDGTQLELLPEEKAIIHQFAVLHAFENRLDIADVIGLFDGSPFTAIYHVMNGSKAQTEYPEYEFAPEHLLLSRRYERFEISPPIWVLYYNAFFAFLANHMLGRDSLNTEWLTNIGNHTWHRRFLHHLHSISRSLAGVMVQHEPFSLQQFYSQIDMLERPQLYPSHEEFHFVEAANEALEHISLDCMVLSIEHPRQSPRISRDDLASVFRSPYCYPRIWLKHFNDIRRNWLTDDALNWLFSTQETTLAEQIEVFPERAEFYASLALTATIHSRGDDARHFVRLAADNMVTYGEHKDLLFFQVIGGITTYHAALPNEHEGRQTARQCLLKLAPAIACIGQYTDGDETDGLPRELAEAVAQIAPDLLPTYYLWLAEQEDYYNASYAFRVFVQTADLNNLLNRVIAETAVDEWSITSLKDRANANDEGAKAVLERLINYFGERILEQNPKHAPPLSPDFASTSDSDRIQPDPAKYTPDQLGDYLIALQGQHLLWETEPVANWITHWSNAGSRYEVYHAIKAHVDSGGEFPNFDAVFDLALSLFGLAEAYQWLVKAHKEDNGWQRYYTSKERAVKRWQFVKDLYPNDWFRFIQDTVIRKRPGTWSWYLDSFAYVRIIEFCLLMNQHELAGRLMQTVVDESLRYLPIDLPPADWVPFDER